MSSTSPSDDGDGARVSGTPSSGFGVGNQSVSGNPSSDTDTGDGPPVSGTLSLSGHVAPARASPRMALPSWAFDYAPTVRAGLQARTLSRHLSTVDVSWLLLYRAPRPRLFHGHSSGQALAVIGSDPAGSDSVEPDILCTSLYERDEYRIGYST